MDGDTEINPDSEYRIYISSMGDEPVAKDIRGYALIYILGFVRQAHSQDTIYIREITETVVRVIQPEEEIGNGFYFPS